MSDPFPTIPWSTPALWKEANACLSKTIQNNAASMRDLYPIANTIRELLEKLFPIMDELCELTCPNCTNICCRRAWVWADFKDLLFFHMAGVIIPEHQLLQRQKDKCRYACSDGCRLERIQRPFVCTWYLCPDQSAILKKTQTKRQDVSDYLQHIKVLRKKIEASFIAILL